MSIKGKQTQATAPKANTTKPATTAKQTPPKATAKVEPKVEEKELPTFTAKFARLAIEESFYVFDLETIIEEFTVTEGKGKNKVETINEAAVLNMGVNNLLIGASLLNGVMVFEAKFPKGLEDNIAAHTETLVALYDALVERYPSEMKQVVGYYNDILMTPLSLEENEEGAEFDITVLWTGSAVVGETDDEEADDEEESDEEEGVDLEAMDLKALKAFATENEVEFGKKVTKEELIELIEAALGEESDDEEGVDIEVLLAETSLADLKKIAKACEIVVTKKDDEAAIIAKLAEADEETLIETLTDMGIIESDEEADEEEEADDEDGEIDVEAILEEVELADLKKIAKACEVAVTKKDDEASLIAKLLEADEDALVEALTEMGLIGETDDEEADDEEESDEEEGVDLEAMDLKALKAFATENEVEFGKKVTKEELIELIEAALGEEEEQEAPDYDAMSLVELKALCDESGIEYGAKAKKTTLVAALIEHSTSESVEQMAEGEYDEVLDEAFEDEIIADDEEETSKTKAKAGKAKGKGKK